MMGRMRFPKPSLAAFALAAWAAVIPAAAVQVGNGDFKLQFPAGWSELGIGIPAPAITVGKGMAGAGGAATLMGFPHEGNLTQAEITAYIATYAAGDSLTIVERGPRPLGGKQFAYIEFKKANPSGAAKAAERYRLYDINQGGFLFQA
ncbi:MAG TPA: hypothetical protein VJ385_09735, partial [Fibrobacteria bacterium]|nr:hypothetical protein [Fibrobacteria bacterium]